MLRQPPPRSTDPHWSHPSSPRLSNFLFVVKNSFTPRLSRHVSEAAILTDFSSSISSSLPKTLSVYPEIFLYRLSPKETRVPSTENVEEPIVVPKSFPRRLTLIGWNRQYTQTKKVFPPHRHRHSIGNLHSSPHFRLLRITIKDP